MWEGQNYRPKKTYSFWLPYSKSSDACRRRKCPSAGYYCFLLAGEQNWSRTIRISRRHIFSIWEGQAVFLQIFHLERTKLSQKKVLGKPSCLGGVTMLQKKSMMKQVLMCLICLGSLFILHIFHLGRTKLSQNKMLGWLPVSVFIHFYTFSIWEGQGVFLQIFHLERTKLSQKKVLG